jgi:hypothetical protein
MNRRNFLLGLLASAAAAPVAKVLADGVALTSMAHPVPTLAEASSVLSDVALRFVDGRIVKITTMNMESIKWIPILEEEVPVPQPRHWPTASPLLREEFFECPTP